MYDPLKWGLRKTKYGFTPGIIPPCNAPADYFLQNPEWNIVCENIRFCEYY